MSAIAKYLEAAEKYPERVYVSGDCLYYERRNDLGHLDYVPVSRADALNLAEAARNAADEVRELVRELNRLDMKFRSGNGVPVERATITADEWNRIRELVG